MHSVVFSEELKNIELPILLDLTQLQANELSKILQLKNALPKNLSSKEVDELKTAGMETNSEEIIKKYRIDIFNNTREELHNKVFDSINTISKVIGSIVLDFLNPLKSVKTNNPLGILSKLSSLPKNVYDIYKPEYKHIIESLRKQAENSMDVMVLWNLLDEHYTFVKGTPKEMKNFIDKIEREILSIRREFNEIAKEEKIKNLENNQLVRSISHMD